MKQKRENMEGLLLFVVGVVFALAMTFGVFNAIGIDWKWEAK